MLTCAWCIATGRLLVRQWALALAVGAAVVSTFVALLGFAGLAYPAVFVITAVICIIRSLWGRRGGWVANPPQVDKLP
jgi:hypothetical protein